MILGFTGTQGDVTPAQADTLQRVLESFRFTEFRHGDCVGADALGHQIALKIKNADEGRVTPYIAIHPPDDEKKRAFCQGADVILPAEPYIQRNHSIVNHSEVLIAVPSTANEQLRSGTWATVRYARSAGLLIIRVNPDGSTEIG